ncbi:MAG: 1-phosphofructokinase [Deltaproteobacteria bacterium]|nr:1-phosphofructokinase [Deltaproteobacteria bacterium]
MIYTLTLNPALDWTIVLDHLEADDTLRPIAEERYAAGKGINVSRVIRALGGNSVATGFAGGYEGLELEGRLVNEGVLTNFTRIGGSTRVNLIIKEKDTGRQFSIGSPGPEIRMLELGQLYEELKNVPDPTYVVISGSVPKGIDPGIYSQFIVTFRKRGAKIALDADGKALRRGIEMKPDFIKPNLHELKRLSNKELKSTEEVVIEARRLVDSGISHVIVSMGPKGLIVVTAETAIEAIPPVVQVDSTVGAGDSALGAFILAHSRGSTLEECTVLACAAGTATSITPATALCSLDLVEAIKPHVTWKRIL